MPAQQALKVQPSWWGLWLRCLSYLSARLKWPELGPAVPPTSLQAPSGLGSVSGRPGTSIWVWMITGSDPRGGMAREWGEMGTGRRKRIQYGESLEQTTAGDTWAPSPWDLWESCAGTPWRARGWSSCRHHPQLDTAPCARRLARAEAGTSRWGLGTGSS